LFAFVSNILRIFLDMASLPLPRVESLADYTSFQLTVLPYLEQLRWLPDSLREAGRDVDNLKAVYLATNPLVSAVAFGGVLAALFFIAAEINRNYSQVDRFWSILPALYNVHFAVWARLSGIQTSSLDTIAIISAVWSVSRFFILVLVCANPNLAIGPLDFQLLAQRRILDRLGGLPLADRALQSEQWLPFHDLQL
jgi:hypothetical protein